MSTVSLCIATYRRQERLAAVLDDLTRQTRPPDEVVVVDNGSTDASVDVALVSGGRVVEEPRPGYGSALLAGMALVGSLIVAATLLRRPSLLTA